MYENKNIEKGKGIRKERETQYIRNMSGSAAKRAKRGEMYLLPQRLANVASSGQSVVAPPSAHVGENRSLEPDISAREAKLQKSAAARAALRAVMRAVHCANSTKTYVPFYVKDDQQSALTVFKRQLDEMDKDEKVKTEEYDDVINDMNLLATHYKKEAFGK